jgi:O-antigen ligase
LGVLQAVSGYQETFYLYAITNVGSPTGLFANRNHHAAMICALLPLLAVFAGSARRADFKRIYPWLASVAGGVMLLVLLITGSRAGLVLSLVALASVAYLYRPTSDKGGTRLFSLVLLVAGALMVALLAATFLNIGGLERLLNIESAEERRLQSWPVIADLVMQYFPLGAGIGSFVEVYMIAEPRELLGPNYLNHAHNDFLEWALDGGLPAVALILVAVTSWLGNTAYLIRNRRKLDGASLALAGAAVILILGLASLVDYPLRVPSLAVLMAIAAIWMVEPKVGARAQSRSLAEELRDLAS